MSWRPALAALLLAASLTACEGSDEAADLPPPVEATGEISGYFCGMLLAEHGGPKGQIHLRSRTEPVWFSSVRDTVAFTLLKEEPKDVAAIYVNDMGQAKSWDQPESGTWIDARTAWFVLDSDRVGGMGLPEAVPFGTETAANEFVAEHGGRVVRLTDIPETYVLGMPDEAPSGAADDSSY